uniref:(northern house mosquito) hypothetical protein n=1 Tax=Culex pipiens TaxID=7175 RepID=A0A8D8H8P6_CULPI
MLAHIYVRGDGFGELHLQHPHPVRDAGEEVPPNLVPDGEDFPVLLHGFGDLNVWQVQWKIMDPDVDGVVVNVDRDPYRGVRLEGVFKMVLARDLDGGCWVHHLDQHAVADVMQLDASKVRGDYPQTFLHKPLNDFQLRAFREDTKVHNEWVFADSTHFTESATTRVLFSEQ